VARSKVKVWAAAGSEILNKSDQLTRQNQVCPYQLTSIWLDFTWCRKGENHTMDYSTISQFLDLSKAATISTL
jgi:hypothetical protein